MTRITPPLLGLAVAVPVGYGLAIGRLHDHATAWRHATIAAVLTLAAGVAAAVLATTTASNGALGVDALSAPLLPLVALITLATVIARPRGTATPHTLGALLVTAGLLIGLLTARDLGLLAFFWITSTIPALLEIRRGAHPATRRGAHPASPTRAWAVFLLVSAVPLVAAIALLLAASPTAHGASLGFDALRARGLHAPAEIAAGVLLAVAVLLRGAAVPAHAWVPLSFTHGPPGMVSLLWAAQPAAYLLVRVLLPLFPAAAPFRTILAVLGLITAIYAALVALAQTDLRRTLGYLAISHGGIILVGLASSQAEGIGGALVLWLSSGVAITGLTLAAVAVAARTGTTDMRRLGGLARPMPRLATAFLVFGLAAVGMPGMLGFVAEDMLVHGVLASYPAIAAALLVATMLNGITMMRAFARVFLGAPASLAVAVPAGRDLRPRERVAVVVLAGALILPGLMPGPAVAARSTAAVDLAAPTHALVPRLRKTTTP